MHKQDIFLSIPILVIFLTGCTGNAAAQANEVTSTSVPEKVEPTATPEVLSRTPPVSCPVTVSQDQPFTPPAPYDTLGFQGYFWFGSDSLWTSLPEDGVWLGYTQKVFWWRDGYVWNEEPKPNLILTGERLDAKAPPLNVSRATNAYASDIGSRHNIGVI
jgi:hypothetical protein